MAVTLTAPVADGDVAALVNTLTQELQFLLDGADVPSGIQAKIASCGITSSDVFAKLEDDVAGFRVFVKADLTMDPATSTHNRVATAKLINAWETAQVRGKKRKEESAELRVGDLPLKLSRTTHLGLRKSFNTMHGEMSKEQTPHPDYLESRLQQLEDGEVRTERLYEVVSLAEDDGAPDCGVTLLADGKLRAKRTTAKKGSMPTNTEGCREKISLIARGWEIIRLRIPGKPYLQNYQMSLWDKYAAWILGDKVAKL